MVEFRIVCGDKEFKAMKEPQEKQTGRERYVRA